MNNSLFHRCENVWCECADTDYRRSGLACWLFIIDELYYPVLLQQEQMRHINPAGECVSLVLQETHRGIFMSDVMPVHQQRDDDTRMLKAVQGLDF
jgi:hypothetical protein